MNNRNRKVAPAIPFAFLHGATGHVVNAVPAPIQWSHSHYITSDFKYSDNDTRIILNRASGGCLYKFYAQAGAIRKVGAPEYLILQLYVNGIAQPCCLSHGAISTTGTHGDATLISVFYANAGDIIEIYASVDAGTADLEEDTARLIIEGLPMKGWDNSAGGRTDYRGGVMR